MFRALLRRSGIASKFFVFKAKGQAVHEPLNFKVEIKQFRVNFDEFSKESGYLDINLGLIPEEVVMEMAVFYVDAFVSGNDFQARDNRKDAGVLQKRF